MTIKRDYYEILGVGRNASDEDVKRAFRHLAMEYHPDRNKEANAVDRFKEVNEAYQVLSDPDKRSAYDRFGHAAVNGNSQGFDGADIFGGFGDVFDAFFGGGFGRRQRHGPQRGQDLQIALTLSFKEAALGVDKDITFSRTETCQRCDGNRGELGTKPEVCSNCRGSGQVRRSQQSLFGQFVQVVACPTCAGEGHTISDPCKQCRGTGLERKPVTRAVTIPPGVDDGSRVRLSREGSAGAMGGPRGDLYIAIEAQQHTYFDRNGFNLLYELPLNFSQAALGDTVEVPTLDGTTPVRIPTGIQSGTILRVKGEGVPYLQRKGRGDLLISVRVVTPTSLTSDQLQLFEQLSAQLNSPPKPNENDESWFNRFKR
ncbi:MAG: molecular chaperone DnaJ [SAR202 cluster bacterium Io17-Chloro-G3]|nr:MAG: molecular chaperone DnaJ [SAR202 cluster bacterium Io17-Chloro-G3]